MSEQLCRNNRGKHGCQETVTDDGEAESGYCETCYWPGIVEANEKYEELLRQGHTRVQAAEMSGLNEGQRQHHLGTTPITTVEQDEDDETEDREADITDRILTRIEEDNEAGDGV
jgi:hypothetical protein